jgi:hypothetical protein
LWPAVPVKIGESYAAKYDLAKIMIIGLCGRNDNRLEIRCKKGENMIKLGTYRHYKGNLYEVIGFAKHTETLEDMVIYKALYGERGTWVRPMSMWGEIVEIDGKTVKRFECVSEKVEAESQAELNEALRAINSTISKCEKAQTKLREGSPQHTLTKRRIKALYIATELINKELEARKNGKETP